MVIERQILDISRSKISEKSTMPTSFFIIFISLIVFMSSPCYSKEIHSKEGDPVTWGQKKEIAPTISTELVDQKFSSINKNYADPFSVEKNAAEKRMLSISDPTVIFQGGGTGTVNLYTPRVSLDDKILYLTDFENGKAFWAYNISNISNPILLGVYTFNSGSQAARSISLTKDGKIAFVTLQKDVCGLAVFNISDHRNMTLITIYKRNIVRLTYGILSYDDKTYFVSDTFYNCLFILNVTDLNNITELAKYSANNPIIIYMIFGNDSDTLFIADRSSGLIILNVTDRKNPTLIRRSIFSGSPSVRAVALSADFKTIFVCDRTTDRGIFIVNITNITNPIVIVRYSVSGIKCNDLKMSSDGRTLFYAQLETTAGLFAVDVQNLQNPVALGNKTINSMILFHIELTSDNNYAFLVNTNPASGFVILNVSDYFRPCPGTLFAYSNGSCLSGCIPGFQNRNSTSRYCDDNPCKENVLVNRQYYSYDGYCYDCSSNCSACNNYDACTSCDFPFEVLGGYCDCPADYVMSSERTCISTLTLILAIDIYSDPDNVICFANLTQSELNSYPTRVYYWSVIANSTNSTLLNLIQSYLQSVSSYQVYLSYKYLEPNVYYNISCYYINTIGGIMQNFTIFNDLSYLYPQFGPLNETRLIARDVRLTISNNLLESKIPVLNESYFKGTWTITKGNISIYTSDLYKFVIPGCTLKTNSSYGLVNDIVFKNNFRFQSSRSFEFATSPHILYLEVEYLNRKHPRNIPIDLKAILRLEDPCQDSSFALFMFTWTCQISSISPISYSPCLNSSSIFGNPSNLTSISIPTSYFTNSKILKITLVANNNQTRLEKTGTIEISSTSTLIIGIKCLNPPCEKYNPNTELYLQSIIQNNPGVNIQLQWSVIPSSVDSISYGNTLYINSDTQALGVSQLTITCQVVDSFYSGGAELFLPVNTSPKNGSLIVMPGEGIQMKTKFQITASGWKDDDLPLTYAFFYSILETTFSLGETQAQENLIIILPGDTRDRNLSLSANIYDSYNAFSLATATVLVKNVNPNISVTFDELNRLISEVNTTPLKTRITSLSIIASQSAKAEANFLELRKNLVSCINCPNGLKFCAEGVCQCQLSVSEQVDCTMNKDIFEKIIQTKVRILKHLNDGYLSQNDSSSSDLTAALSQLQILTSNPEFVNVELVSNITNILDNTLNFTENNKNFTLTQRSQAVGLLDNLIDYFSNYDCNCTLDACKILENRTRDYLEQLSDKSLENKIPGQEAYNLINSYFDLTSITTGICNLSTINFQSSANTPSVSLVPLNSSTLNCSTVVKVKIYTFKNNTFGCSPFGMKNILLVEITDAETGKLLNHLFKAIVIMPIGQPCPIGCMVKLEYCDCPLDLFDVRKQLDRIFTMSSIKDIGNVDAILSWAWYNSPIFWANIGMVAWLGGSLLALRFIPYLNDFDIMKSIESKDKISRARGITSMYMVLSDVINIYVVKTPGLPKFLKVVLYYIKLVLYSTYSAAFATSGATDSILVLVRTLQLYIILLPVVTVTPIYSILTAIVTNQFKKEKEISVKKSTSIRKNITMLFLILGSLACIFVMFVIAANKNSTAEGPWLATFIVSVLQDLAILPLLILVVQKILLKIRARKLQKAPNSKDKMIESNSSARVYPALEKIYKSSSKKELKSEHDDKVPLNLRTTELSLSQRRIQSRSLQKFPKSEADLLQNIELKN